MDVFFRFRHSSGRDKYARVRSHSMCIIKRAKETVITSKDYTRTYTKKVFLLCSTVSFFCRFYLHENLLTSLAALVGSVCVALSQLSVIISSFSAIQLKNSDLFCIFTHSVIRHSVAAVIKCDIANRYKHTFGRHHACYVCVSLSRFASSIFYVFFFELQTSYREGDKRKRPRTTSAQVWARQE